MWRDLSEPKIRNRSNFLQIEKSANDVLKEFLFGNLNTRLTDRNPHKGRTLLALLILLYLNQSQHPAPLHSIKR
jgi:hypothetical protein